MIHILFGNFLKESLSSTIFSLIAIEKGLRRTEESPR